MIFGTNHRMVTMNLKLFVHATESEENDFVRTTMKEGIQLSRSMVFFVGTALPGRPSRAGGFL